MDINPPLGPFLYLSRGSRSYQEEWDLLRLELGDRAARWMQWEKNVPYGIIKISAKRAIGPYPLGSLEYLVLAAERQDRRNGEAK